MGGTSGIDWHVKGWQVELVLVMGASWLFCSLSTHLLSMFNFAGCEGGGVSLCSLCAVRFWPVLECYALAGVGVLA